MVTEHDAQDCPEPLVEKERDDAGASLAACYFPFQSVMGPSPWDVPAYLHQESPLLHEASLEAPRQAHPGLFLLHAQGIS